ncbi:MAG TPA: L,D-transpeptidase [Gammaproteobacteria bacterium]|nr:L,D-transpeptidase [Gammaproteobacteria bacterium]
MELRISIPEQRLDLLRDGQAVAHYTVSTAANGAGEELGSECTPRGRHRIRARIGAGCPVNTVFIARRPTGEVYTPAMGRAQPERDWILTRILWLCGCEPGFNRFGEVDTMRRYIYIHGVPDEMPMGKPASHGCIRMRNQDIIELFDVVEVGTPVRIDA